MPEAIRRIGTDGQTGRPVVRLPVAWMELAPGWSVPVRGARLLLGEGKIVLDPMEEGLP